TWNSQSNENKFVGSFKSVFFISNLTGWISGSNGTIFKTVNGGINFIQQEKVTTKNLNSIRFISDQTGFAVGDSGIILKTINGGSNWQLQTTTTNKNLQSVFMLSADSAWISGLEGTILKTSTGGSSWIICNSTTTDHLFSIYISDNGIGSSSGRQIVRTTDFGNSWVVTLPTPPNYLLSLNFPSDSVGYAAGRFWSYKTVNQGSTWNRILGSSTGGQDFSSVYFTSENTGYMVGASGEIKTTNGGNNWFSVEDGYNNVLNSVFFSSALTGWAVGDDGLILKTTSGGLVSLNENHTITVNEYILNQNYPNPFNPTTKINFSIPTTRYTILKVYDVLGKEVQTLVNQKLAPGNYEVEFDGSDFSSGIYFYRLETEDYSVAKRMLLTK
ncbi:MAG: YCF48-related protein, partial [Ignavibacteria bacterium]